MVSVTFAKFLSSPSFEKNLRTAAFEKKQQMNYRFNIKNGVTENHLNYLREKCNKKYSNKSGQSFYKIAIYKT